MSSDNPGTPKLPGVEIGFVSRDTGLRDFLAAVFRLEPRPPLELPSGNLYRLDGYDRVLKVFVPHETPTPQPRSSSFYDIEGPRFLTIRVTGLDEVVSRVVANGGTVVEEPREPVPGVRIAMIRDPGGTWFELSERLA